MDEDERIILEVRKRPVLYDTNNKLYKNNRNRIKIWREVAEALDLPVELCQTRWKRLRDKFQRSQKQTGIVATNSKTYPLIASLSFLQPIVPKYERNLGNSLTHPSKSEESSLQEFISDCELPEQTSIEKLPYNCNASSSQMSNEDRLSMEDYYTSRPIKPNSDIGKIESADPLANYDGLDHFGLSVANDLRGMAPSEQRRAKLEIAVILANCKYKN